MAETCPLKYLCIEGKGKEHLWRSGVSGDRAQAEGRTLFKQTGNILIWVTTMLQDSRET
jgi:hypothetical protein